MTGPRKRFQGIYPVLYALFDDRGTLDRTAMQAQVEHCIAAGAHGIMVLGLVTEVHKMDVNEHHDAVCAGGDAVLDLGLHSGPEIGRASCKERV